MHPGSADVTTVTFYSPSTQYRGCGCGCDCPALYALLIPGAVSKSASMFGGQTKLLGDELSASFIVDLVRSLLLSLSWLLLA